MISKRETNDDAAGPTEGINYRKERGEAEGWGEGESSIVREKIFRDPSLPFADSFGPYHFVIGYLEAREMS